jgi:hypothetical protein
MRMYLLPLVVMGMSAPALAQSNASAGNYAGLGSPGNTGDRDCLVNKKTRKLVCKTPAEWRKESDRLAKVERSKMTAN